MNNHPITDYSVCSTAELEALLSAELTKDDPTASLAILAELEARTAKAPDVEAAWDSFRAHYLPLEGGSLYEEARNKPRVLRFGRRLAAAAIAACLACMLIVQAGGTDILSTMVRWTKDELRIQSPTLGESFLLPEAGSQDAAKAASSSAPGAEDIDLYSVDTYVIEPEVTVCASLAEGLTAMGLEDLIPTAIPAGYELDSAQIQDLEGWRDFTAQYFNDAGDLLYFSYTCYGKDSVFSSVVCKDDSEVEVYERRGTTYYFVSNGRYESVNWMQDEQTQCHISGPVTREELKALVDSMYD